MSLETKHALCLTCGSISYVGEHNKEHKIFPMEGLMAHLWLTFTELISNKYRLSILNCISVASLRRVDQYIMIAFTNAKYFNQLSAKHLPLSNPILQKYANKHAFAKVYSIIKNFLSKEVEERSADIMMNINTLKYSIIQAIYSLQLPTNAVEMINTKILTAYQFTSSIEQQFTTFVDILKKNINKKTALYFSGYLKNPENIHLQNLSSQLIEQSIIQYNNLDLTHGMDFQNIMQMLSESNQLQLLNSPATPTISKEAKWIKDIDSKGMGSFQYENGDIFDGSWKNGLKEGKGTMQFSNKSHYNGEWKNDVMNGNGTLTKINGAKYEGEFVDGKFEGHGVYTSKKRKIYIGQWRKNVREGLGIRIYQYLPACEEKINSLKSMSFENIKKETEALHSIQGIAFYIGHFKNNVYSGEGYEKNEKEYIIQGNFENGKPHGYCTKIFSSHKHFVGNFVNGCINGYGRMYTIKKDYIGNFQDETQTGKGITIYHNKHKIFVGNYKLDKKCGLGFKIINVDRFQKYNVSYFESDRALDNLKQETINLFNEPAIDLYYGEWQNHKLSGNGIIKHGNSNYYFGKIFNLMREGDGLLIEPKFLYQGLFHQDNLQKGFKYVCEQEGSPTEDALAYIQSNYNINSILSSKKVEIYQGSFKNRLLNGEGCILYSNGDIYNGQLADEKKENNGKLTSKDFVYQGQWKDDMFNGEGTLEYFGNTYIGCFLNNKKHGVGKLTLSNGIVYVGNFIENVSNGSGKIIYKKGDVYEGEVYKLNPHGKGTLTTLGGQVYNGHWENGNIIEYC